jgi:predicted metal-binding protein
MALGHEPEPPAPGSKAQAFGSARVALNDPTQSSGDAAPGAPRADDRHADDARAERAITIYVCITCRGGRPLDLVPVPGAVLADATALAAAGTAITVRRVRCLANCNRGLSAAVRRDGAWTYVFGNLDPASGARALIDGARLFACAPDGLMPWRGRPEPLKRGLVARTPPFDFAGEPE